MQANAKLGVPRIIYDTCHLSSGLNSVKLAAIIDQATSLWVLKLIRTSAFFPYIEVSVNQQHQQVVQPD